MSLIQKFETEGTFFDGELNGVRPRGPLNNTARPFINGTFDKGEYLNNLPNDIDTPDEISRAKDATEGRS